MFRAHVRDYAYDGVLSKRIRYVLDPSYAHLAVSEIDREGVLCWSRKSVFRHRLNKSSISDNRVFISLRFYFDISFLHFSCSHVSGSNFLSLFLYTYIPFLNEQCLEMIKTSVCIFLQLTCPSRNFVPIFTLYFLRLWSLKDFDKFYVYKNCIEFLLYISKRQ